MALTGVTASMLGFGIIATIGSMVWVYKLNMLRRQGIVLASLSVIGAICWNISAILSWFGYNPGGSLITHAIVILYLTHWIIPFIVLPIIALLFPLLSAGGRFEVSEEFHAFEKELGLK